MLPQALCRKVEADIDAELQANQSPVSVGIGERPVIRRWRRAIATVRRRGAREVLFLLSVSVKGLDGLAELIGGAALFLVTPTFVLHAVRFLTQDEIAEDPRDLVANALRHAAGRLSFATEHFMGFYLLIHGVVKLVLVWALLGRVHVAYPLSIVVFAGFIVYQLYRYSFTHAAGLLVLSAFDLFVIGIVWLEYRAMRGVGSRMSNS
jgi:uncharacterized membrane protein